MAHAPVPGFVKTTKPVRNFPTPVLLEIIMSQSVNGEHHATVVLPSYKVVHGILRAVAERHLLQQAVAVDVLLGK